jgi:hypothetical protein
MPLVSQLTFDYSPLLRLTHNHDTTVNNRRSTVCNKLNVKFHKCTSDHSDREQNIAENVQAI